MHTRLWLADPVDLGWSEGAISVAWGFGEVAALRDQPVLRWSGAPAALETAAPAVFRDGSALPVLIEDISGVGVAALATSSGDGAATLAGLPAPVPTLTNPLRALYDLLPVSRGKTIPDEVLGSGDARIPGQVFTLAKSPVTYLASGSGWASTVVVRVNGRPWREVGFFYGQPANAEVFVTREDERGATQVMFGDGTNGARLPTGVNNIVATYRIGAGAEAPPAGKLTVAANPFPGLIGVRNPVAVGGGADAEPADKIRRYAPRSVLTFGRAVSVLDYEALAAQAPGVTRARAAWAWDETRQRTAVTVYVGDDPAARDSADAALAAAGDPNRPISVVLATPLPTRLTLTLLVTAGMDATKIIAAVVETLVGEEGLFSPAGLGVGQSVFDSAIAAAVLAVDGTVAILQSGFAVNLGWGFVDDPAPLHKCGEDGWFDLTADRIVIAAQAEGG
ncbi:MAG: baseplate J/gp47 family protein [Burkholderiales bacterium]|nr:baseplate J/gp47 family protein [Burkholderiales bacterium]